MTPGETRLIIRGILEDIELARQFVADFARHAGINEDVIHSCELAIDETCTNVIEHGYQMNGTDKEIVVVCAISSPYFDLTIIDEGPPFNPLEHLEPNPDMPLHQRGEGGWGIYFVKQMMDQVSYERRGRFNCFLMRKRLTSLQA